MPTIEKVSYEKIFPKINLIGQKYGLLTVVEYLGTSKQGSRWVCKCDCGNTRETTTGRLNEKRITSCGCNDLIPFATHQMTSTRMYRIWCAMKSRCLNPNYHQYKDYGGRGITICGRWLNNFLDFYNDMIDGYADNLQLDRDDNEKGYYKENCKWSTRPEQARNKRNNYWYERDGIRMVKMDWAKHLGVSHHRINERLRRGFTFDQVYEHFKTKQLCHS